MRDWLIWIFIEQLSLKYSLLTQIVLLTLARCKVLLRDITSAPFLCNYISTFCNDALVSTICMETAIFYRLPKQSLFSRILLNSVRITLKTKWLYLRTTKKLVLFCITTPNNTASLFTMAIQILQWYMIRLNIKCNNMTEFDVKQEII